MTVYTMLITLMVLSVYTCTITASKRLSNVCETAKKCSECLTMGPQCVWCLEEELRDAGMTRCQLKNESTCTQIEHTTGLDNKVRITKALPLRPKRPITPQKIDTFIRKGGSITVSFTVLSRKTLKLKLRHSKAFEVSVRSNCTGFEYKKKKVSCRGVSPGEIEFLLTIKMKRCISKTKKVKVTVNSNKKKTLKIKVYTVCTCDCERDTKPKSLQCMGQGSYSCGECTCDAPFFGKYCECDNNSDESTCISPYGGQAVCSNRGKCVCGQCHCSVIHANSARRYSGRYCECDNFSCDYFNGELCGGITRGTCVCGRCECRSDYSGQACEIVSDSTACISPNSQSVCNNAGDCIGNRCRCRGNYLGPTCDDCPTCPGRCAQLRPCVECNAFNSGVLSQEECIEKCDFMREEAEMVDDVSISERGGEDFRMCMFRDEDFCLFKFAYGYSDTGLRKIKIEVAKMCPEM